MQARWIKFGEIELEGERYTHDVVIAAGQVHKRHKKASKAYRGRLGHTPLSAEEELPWGGRRLIIGTGQYGRLPVLPEVWKEAERRGVEIIAAPTEQALELLGEVEAADAFAVVHLTC